MTLASLKKKQQSFGEHCLNKKAFTTV